MRFGSLTDRLFLLLMQHLVVSILVRTKGVCSDCIYATDINKIVRMDYANDTLYMHLMVEAFGIWRQWNKERAEKNLDPVFHQSGVLLFSGKDKFSDFERDCMKNIREAGYGHFIEEFTSPEQIIEKFPQFQKAVENGFNTAYLNKEGGMLS